METAGAGVRVAPRHHGATPCKLAFSQLPVWSSGNPRDRGEGREWHAGGGLPSAGRTGRCRETVPSLSRHCFLFLRHRVPPCPVRRGRLAWSSGRWSPHPAEPSPGQVAVSGAGARTGMSREPRQPRRLGCRRESDHSVPASPGGSDEQERVPQGVGPWRAGAARDPGFRARGGSQPLSGGMGWAGTV